MGGIGLGPRGRKVLDGFFEHKDCQFIGIADPQKERREIIKRKTDRFYGNSDCVKTREQPVCNSTEIRYGHMACFAAAISWKLGRKVTFNPDTESFVNDAEANHMRTYKRRAPYTI